MKSSPILSVQLGYDLKRKWRDHCAKSGVTPSAAVRQVIRHLLGNATQNHASAHIERDQPDTSRRRLELRLTESELAKIRVLADSLEMSSNQWVVNLVRANLTAEPQFGMVELRVLGESNTRLLAIGRNLNQIARRINADSSEHVLLKVEHIGALSRQIVAHTEKVSGMIRANIDRWRLK
ncbi:hypothetical protein [Burkholderia multivorans]|uniref:hypothetical protein n=1 Tax=Burkholderia multivorans TaxID=87883 RepID=UPI00209EC9F4|nr:hypothetical protein [Burkholderia multivorans]MCO8590382.1 plasmid mobilization relaxosome protein MobC [Burkholderia multivorans]MCO8632657.1 plasmid mobilization relaxosome protein MobC [Burkholderia multivorans]MCO8647206.1 plasmid mobilization relaxosome protein MobC [Burkholderia multivorans]